MTDLDELTSLLEAAVGGGGREAAREVLDRVGEQVAAGAAPFPVRRPGAYDAITHRIVTAHAASGLTCLGLRLGGLPQFAEDAARVVGLHPAAAIDTTIEIDGEVAPSWCFFADAQAGLRPLDPIVDAVAALGSGDAAAVLSDLARGLHGLGFLPPQLARFVADPVAWEEHATERLGALATRLGPGSERVLWRVAADLLEHDVSLHAEVAPVLATLVTMARARGAPTSNELSELIVQELLEAPPHAAASLPRTYALLRDAVRLRG